ncbi:MAG: hypothetical protein IJC17_06680 [Clostridia bacterium]|nr:hypothetical protein [Clostridia bacterium]
MRAIHSLICYKANGVCEIAGTEQKCFGGQTQEYYVLKPLHSPASTVFVPIGNEALESAMRPLLTREEIFKLIENIVPSQAVEEENPRARKELFNSIINSGDHHEILGLVLSIRQQRDRLLQEGKKLRVADDAAMKRAETLLNDEFSAVLGVPPTEVEAYIRTEITA